MDTPTILGLEQPPQPPPQPLPLKKSRIFLGTAAVALGLFLAWLRAWASAYGLVTRDMFADALARATVPAVLAGVIVYVISRKRGATFDRFGVWFSGLSLLFLVTSAPQVRLQQHLGNLMKEAAGTKVVDNSGPPAIDQAVRNFMRDVLERRRAFDRDVAQFTPALAKLYSPESFSSREAMQGAVDAVQGVAALDQHYSQDLESIPDRIQAQLERSGASDAGKEFTAGVRESFENQKILVVRRQATAVEREWADATVALYQFAIANATQIRVRGSHLEASNEKVRVRFNELMKKARTLNENLDALSWQIASAQRAAMQQFELTPAELGLEDKSQPARK